MFERVLIIETSGKTGQVAVAADGEIVATRMLPEGRRHARDLTARCAELLAERQWRARDLTATIVNVGPGSFTGLRVGLASAKALAYATGCALFGVPVFDALAARIREERPAVEMIADALQGQVYCQRFHRNEKGWASSEPIRIRQFVDWSDDVLPGSLIAGPGVPSYRERMSKGATIAEPSLGESDCASLLHVVRNETERYRASPWEIEPIYLRGSSAEEKRRLVT